MNVEHLYIFLDVICLTVIYISPTLVISPLFNSLGWLTPAVLVNNLSVINYELQSILRYRSRRFL